MEFHATEREVAELNAHLMAPDIYIYRERKIVPGPRDGDVQGGGEDELLELPLSLENHLPVAAHETEGGAGDDVGREVLKLRLHLNLCAGIVLPGELSLPLVYHASGDVHHCRGQRLQISSIH